MKILAISCSPQRHGNTETLLEEALKGAQQEGSEVELYSVAKKNIMPCDSCRTCWKAAGFRGSKATGRCHINDDMQELYPKMLAADGIIFGTPIYLYAMNGQAKTILDRTFAFDHEHKIALTNKVGGVVVVAASLGLLDALKDFYFYFASMQMLPANYVAAYAHYKGDVQKLGKCMKAAFDLGRQMVLLASKKFEYPEEIEGSHHGYGTWEK